ncbi:MAG: type II toxin-antitoxin system VapC family toxin [Bryobacteraceae bacterium]|nr:type II toxin-antitoxin system VapC family toxin [Bryobacteraceae bacterium]
MPTYFIDTSTLAKRYHKESGSEYMDRILEQLDARSLISHLSVVELESVLAIKTRTGEIDQKALNLARRRFRADLAGQRLIVAPSVHESHFQSARKLLVQYGVAEGLRTLDALQLAIALDLHRVGHIGALVAADQRLCRVASLAGCPAINPEQPGPVLI